MTSEGAHPLVLQGVSKRFGPVVACDAVDLVVRKGEVHGLLGENGAGKSTLMKILLGLVQQDAGTIIRSGQPVAVSSPTEALGIGIGMVHQHFSLVEALTVWENVALGDSGKVDKAAVCAQVREVADRYGLPVNPLARMNRLSAGERQRVELIKCLRRNPSVLIMDEPTSVLTQAESAELFNVLRTLVRNDDRSVILISHKLREIVAATDRVTVLRRGRVVFSSNTADTEMRELARQMVGREISMRSDSAALGLITAGPAYRAGAFGPLAPDTLGAEADGARTPALRMRDLVAGSRGTRSLDSLSLDVGAGEIVGLYGVEGNGQAALGDVLSGLIIPDSGRIEVDGTAVDLRRPGALGSVLGIIPEDRRKSGVVLDMTVAENLVLKSLRSVSGRVFTSRRRMAAMARGLADDFGIVAPSLDAPLRNLSGGNQQKVVLAREMSGRPRVLVAAQPTAGLDVGAIEDMYRRLRAVAAAGVGVLLISTEIEEVLELSSRVAVISGGRISGLLTSDEASAEKLGLLVGGVAA